MKRFNKTIFYILVTIIIILCIIIICLLRRSKEVSYNESLIENVENYDTEVPKNIDVVDMKMENKICSAIILGEFENGKDLTIDDYLRVAKNALLNRYIDLKNDNGTYEEQSIKNIIYSIFGLLITDNKSIEGLEYNNKKYDLTSNREGYIYQIRNCTSDVAAGTAYYNFELYKEFSNGKEEFVGKYFARVVQNTITGDMYIQSISKSK